jgi:beta-galactosidase
MGRIRDAGLDAIQLWCIWGWIESQPGVYRYDDYDELMTLADKAGLRVVLSTIGAIHPFWIHRLVPDSAMVDERGHTVVSSLRGECNVGLSPGGCTDNPRVAELMSAWLTDLAGRYADATNLIGWDAWNETRWCVQADAHVCYCPHTLRAFRQWLDARHGGLEGLSDAWRRRYVDWQDVRPGKYSGRPYTDLMEFQRFLSDRATAHLAMRYQAIRQGDATHFISAHCGEPAIQHGGKPRGEQALCRGVDWDLASQVDGFGCSHFPAWWAVGDEAFGVRVEQVRSANQGKEMWVSELQGGSSRGGFLANRSVQALPQQRWVHAAMGRGAKAVIFWCWRDEVFGCESSGFGLNGWDGLARERLAHMAKTSEIIDKHRDLIDAYRPDPARVGVFFARDNYYLDYAQHGRCIGSQEGVVGYAIALERLKVPYAVVDSEHLDALDDLDVLLMPFAWIVPDQARLAIEAFLRRGGTILCEAETDSFNPLGFYRYPDERPLMQTIGLHDLGRRAIHEGQTIGIDLPGGASADLPVSWLTTPLTEPDATEVFSRNASDQPLLARRSVGEGTAWVLGTFAGGGYSASTPGGALETLIASVLDGAGISPDLSITAGDGDEGLLWRIGLAEQRHLLWLINAGPARRVKVIDRARRLAGASQLTELVSESNPDIQDTQQGREVQLDLPAEGFAVLTW